MQMIYRTSRIIGWYDYDLTIGKEDSFGHNPAEERQLLEELENVVSLIESPGQLGSLSVATGDPMTRESLQMLL
jgi:hypothetical protein